MTSHVVFDIETVGYPLDSFDATQQEYLLRYAQTEEEKTKAIQGLNLTPFTAQVVAIGLFDLEKGKGGVYYQADQKEEWTSETLPVKFSSGSEREILESFWGKINHYTQFITFNGRTFDCPFLMLRSALLGVKPSRNLMAPYRYSADVHVDLLDQLSYHGAVRRFNFDFYCKAFGIESSKAQGITGLDVNRLFGEKQYRAIAEYCFRDVWATAELYRRWETWLKAEA